MEKTYLKKKKKCFFSGRDKIVLRRLGIGSDAYIYCTERRIIKILTVFYEIYIQKKKKNSLFLLLAE